VIPVPDEKWGEVPKALVVLKPNACATEAELIKFCRSRLAHYKCPRSFEFVTSLPKPQPEDSEKRSAEKVLARRGYDSPDFVARKSGT